LPLRLPRKTWLKIVHYFLLGLSSHRLAQLTQLERRRVLRALLRVRQRMASDVPPVFSGTVEVDETYLGGHWRNRRHRPRGSPRGRGTTLKTPVFGILCRSGQVWAQVVPDISRATLQTLIRRRVRRGSVVCSDTLGGYTGIATKGYVHRLVAHGQGQYRSGPGTHINGLEGFWGYLKRRLAAKGGIRRERLPLYLAEYVWRYNHRKDSLRAQHHRLMTLLTQRPKTGG
jgi:transposase-like protein